MSGLLLAATTSSTLAALYVPPGLNPGDTYQLVFVTTGTINATSQSGALSNYHDHAQAQAALNPSMTGTDDGVTYKAIVAVWGPPFFGGPHIDPVAQAGVQGPLYLIDGSALVATNGNVAGTSDLWDGTISVPINVTQYGTTLNTAVWTGAQPGGQQSFSRALGDEVGTSIYGLSSSTDSEWVNSGTASLSSQFSLYAVSSVITVVPEPSSVLLSLVGIAAIGLRRRRN